MYIHSTVIYLFFSLFIVPEFKKVSDNAKDLISKMICKPDKRLKAMDVL